MRSLLEQAKRQREQLTAQVAHFAALAEGLDSMPLQGLDGSEEVVTKSHLETFRGVLLIPPGLRAARLSRTPATAIDKSTAATLAELQPNEQPGPPIAPSSPPACAGSAAAPPMSPPSLCGCPGRPSTEDQTPAGEAIADAPGQAAETAVLSPGRGTPAEPPEVPRHAAYTEDLGNRSAGVLRWPGAASAAPQQRPPAAYLGAGPQTPALEPTEAAPTVAVNVFASMVKTSLKPKPKAAKRPNQDATPTTPNPNAEDCNP